MAVASAKPNRVSSGETATRRSAASSAAVKDDGHVFTIGDLAKEFGVTLRTLRFYEDRGLIKPRRAGLTRLYNENTKERLREIIKGTTLGFTLTEIRAMLGADGTPKAAASLKLTKVQIEGQIEHLERQKADIEKALVELRDMQKNAA